MVEYSFRALLLMRFTTSTSKKARKKAKKKDGVDTATVLFAQCPRYLSYFIS